MRIDPEVVHLNTRVRAWKGRLFDRAVLDEFLGHDDVGLTIEALLETQYERDLAEALSRYEGPDAVEAAASAHLMRVFNRLRDWTSGEFHELLTLFMRRWDLPAIKGLLRAVGHGVHSSLGGVPLLFPGPTLTPAMLEELRQLDTVRELVDRLVTWEPELCGCLLGPLEGYEQGESTVEFEDVLDRHYYLDSIEQLEDMGGEDAEIVRGSLSMEIDRINLRLLLRRRTIEGQARRSAEGVLPRGTLSPRLLERMAHAASIESAMEALTATPYSDLIEGLYMFIQNRRFAPLERLFEVAVMLWLKRQARLKVLSIAVVMHYLWAKYNEVLNLRLIARGEARHLPAGRVREELVYV
jgi:V/A-type H+-transporting ATPase subunit C